MAQKKIRKIWQRLPSLWVILMALAVGYFFIFIIADIFHYKGLVERRNALREEIEEKKQATAAFKKDIEFLNSSEGVESVAREELGLVKSGELAYKVIERRVEAK